MKENGAIKVLELASGLAPWGLKWTENPKITYVKFDLPWKIEEKCQIVEKLIFRSKMNSWTNLYFEGGDVLNHDDMIKAISHFHTNVGLIIIVNEGLFRYLIHDQKKIMVKNIKYLLDRLGGCWITPNINNPYINQSDPFPQLHRLKAWRNYLVSKGVQTHSFESVEFAKSFLRSLGSMLNNIPLEKFSLKWCLHLV
jgi:hypothetical protein